MVYKFTPIDLWPYLLITLIFIWYYITKPNSNSYPFFLTLLIFSCLRYNVGWDYQAYVSLVQEDSLRIYNSRYEPFSKLIFLIGNYLNFYPIVFIIFSFLTLKIFEASIKNISINPLKSWLIYYSMPLFFFASLSTLRQSLAMVIVFYSYRYLINRKYLFSILLILLGSLFHISAIVGLILLPTIKFPLGRRSNLVLFISSFFIGEIILSFILNSNLSFLARIQMYISHEEAKPQLITYLYYSFGIINLIFYNKLLRLNSENGILITIVNIGLILLNIFSFEPITSLRVSAFFILFLVLIIPQYPFIFDKRSAKIIDAVLVFVFLAISFIYLGIYVQAYNNNILEKVSFMPYKSWINNL